MQQTKKFNMDNHCISGDAMSLTTAVNNFSKDTNFLKSVEPFALLSQNEYFVLSWFIVY